MHERMLFVARLEKGERMTDLCREFGISRKTGYKISARYEEKSVVGLYDESRAPQRIPHRTTPEVVARLIKLRQQHPTWGPRKLVAWLAEHEKGVSWPAASTVSELLKKHGLIHKRRRRPILGDTNRGLLSTPTGPNDLWCIDFKGQFRLGNGRYCYPLTVTDAHSRYLLVCEGMDAIDGEHVWTALQRAFHRFGLPKAIRSDNGSPFASRGLCGLSRLSVRWLGLGISHERIELGHPEQNGRHERMHRTLKAETTRPAAQSMLAQQERFDTFCEIYNEQRPHEALEQTPPARHYVPSAQTYTRVPLVYPLHDDVRTVSSCGHIRFGGRTGVKVFVTSALAGHRIGIRELSTDRWLLSYANLDLGVCDLRTGTLLSMEQAKTA